LFIKKNKSHGRIPSDPLRSHKARPHTHTHTHTHPPSLPSSLSSPPLTTLMLVGHVGTPCVMNPSQHGGLFIPSRDAHPPRPTHMCLSADRWRAPPCARRPIALPPPARSLLIWEPLVRRRHLLNATRSNICRANDRLVERIHPPTPAEVLQETRSSN